jgi:hypothetical protein
MSLAADALQPFFVHGLNGLEGRPASVPIPDLIGTQTKIGFYLDFEDESQSIVTDFREPSAILNSLSYDISRFASAAFQSITAIEDEIVSKDKTAWSLIRAYYAAFYAGHSILRLFGESCSYFDRNHVARITDLAKAASKIPGFKINANAYHCALNNSGSIIRSKSLRDGSGGAHEAFWQVFSSRLKQIGEDILNGPLSQFEAQTVYSKIDSIQRTLSSNGAPRYSWLSIIRNSVQYRQSHGVWLPIALKKQDRERLARSIGQWSRDPMHIDIGLYEHRPLDEFALACAFIVALCRALLTRLAERSQRASRSFSTLGPLAILRDMERRPTSVAIVQPDDSEGGNNA